MLLFFTFYFFFLFQLFNHPTTLIIMNFYYSTRLIYGLILGNTLTKFIRWNQYMDRMVRLGQWSQHRHFLAPSIILCQILNNKHTKTHTHTHVFSSTYILIKAISSALQIFPTCTMNTWSICTRIDNACTLLNYVR